jgi:hypothetical protein
MKKNNYVEFFREQPKDKLWTSEQVLAIITGLSGSAKFTQEDLVWARWSIAAHPEWNVVPSDIKFNKDMTETKFNKDAGKFYEDMSKSAVHTRPLPTTLPPTERVVSKSEQKRREVQRGSKKKDRINPLPLSSSGPPMRPDVRHIRDGVDSSKDIHPVVRVDWVESERGWGQRPDGYSLHLTREDAEAFIKDYWDKMPDRGPRGEVPDEYSRPGEPMLSQVNTRTLRKIKKSKNGLRVF